MSWLRNSLLTWCNMLSKHMQVQTKMMKMLVLAKSRTITGHAYSLELVYLMISHFHCSPSGQKLLTPSRKRSTRCSVNAQIILFLAVICDSWYGQSTFTALAQGRSTLRPSSKIQKSNTCVTFLVFEFSFISLSI